MSSRDEGSLAEVLLTKARVDATVVRELVDNERVADEAIGFHAQQAVEKGLKAVLTSRGARFERTHDLDRLLELLEEQALRAPIDPDELTALTHYAVSLRYDDPVLDDEPLDRARAVQLVDQVESWAADLVNARPLDESGEPPPEPLEWRSRNLGTPRVDLEDKEAVDRILDDP